MYKPRTADKLAAIIPALLLIAAVFGQWPYGLYTLIRVIVCGCAIYLAVKSKGTGGAVWPWIMGGVAVLFNPILPVRMQWSEWEIADLAAAVTMLAFAAVYKPHFKL